MAGEWIKMRCDLHDDPAVFRIAALLKIDPYAVIGRLHTFWGWVDRHSVDGVVDGVVAEDVDSIVRLEGFTDALVKASWLEITDSGIRIPKFDRHNGESAKKRALKNERQARWRAGKDANEDGSVDDDASTKTSTEASTREEKRREEKKDKTHTSVPDIAFEKFWEAWPNTDRKTAKAKCREKWDKAGLGVKADEIISHVTTMKAVNQSWKQGFEPAPLTYLNQRRWEDGTATAAREARFEN